MNRTKIFLVAATLLVSLQAPAQTVNDVLNSVRGNKGQRSGSGTTGGSGMSLNNLSNQEVVGALRQALEVGAKNAAGRLSAQNGYFGNQLVKIMLPPEARKVESALRQLGMSKLVDQTILSMNRAAEDAATKAVPIFVNAITTMSIEDGVNIVRGGNGAATNFLRSRTATALTNSFRPVIQTSLNKLNVASYWGQLFRAYNQLPTTFNKVNPDLTAYVTERALNGLFLTIAEEENKIRTNPSARVTDLLGKVFGAR